VHRASSRVARNRPPPPAPTATRSELAEGNTRPSTASGACAATPPPPRKEQPTAPEQCSARAAASDRQRWIRALRLTQKRLPVQVPPPGLQSLPVSRSTSSLSYRAAVTTRARAHYRRDTGAPETARGKTLLSRTNHSQLHLGLARRHFAFGTRWV